MAEREVLGQGVIELVLEDSKIKPSLAAVVKLLESRLGSAVSNALSGKGGGGGKRGALASLASQATKDAARAGKAISRGISSGVVEASKSSTVLAKTLGTVATQATQAAGQVSREFLKAGTSAAKSSARAGASMADSLARGSSAAAKSGARAAASVSKDWSRAAMSSSRSTAKAAADMASKMSSAAGSMGSSSKRASRSISAGMEEQTRRAGILRRTLGALTGAFNRTTQSGMGFGSMLAAVAGGNILANVVGRITMRLKQMLSAGFATSAMMETMSISFTKMVGSEKRASKLLETLREFSSGTPLQFPAIMQAATSLLATQKIAEDKLLPTIQKLTDAAAGSTEGFNAFPRVVRAISQMLSKGKIQAEEMLQLAEAGIPAWDALATGMGKSMAEVQDLSQRGKLGVEAISKLVDGLGSKYAGLAAQQAKTWTGLMSTIKDQIGKVMSDVTSPFFELAKVNLGNLVDWISSDKAQAFFKTIQRGAGMIASVAEKAMNSPFVRLVGLMAAAAVGVTGLAVAATTAFGVIASIVNPVTLAIGAVGAAAVALGASFKKALDSPAGAKIREDLLEIRRLAVEIGTNVVDTVKSGWMSVREAFASVFRVDTDTFWSKAVSGVRRFMDLVSKMSSDWSAAWAYMKAASIKAVISVREEINKWTGGVSEVLIAAHKMWIGMWVGLGKKIVSVVQGVWSFIDRMVGGTSKRLNQIGESFTLDTFVYAIGAAWGAVKAFVSQFRAAFVEIGNVATAAAAGIYEVFRVQFGRLAKFADPDTWLDPSKMKSAISGLFDGADPVSQATTFMDAFNKTLASQADPDFLNYGESMHAEGEALVEMLKRFKSKMSDENKSGIAEAEAAMQDALARMEKARASKRKSREKIEETVSIEKDLDDDAAKEMSKAADGMKDAADRFGKTDIEGLHDSIQDALNDKSDPSLDEAKKQTDILEDIRDGKSRGGGSDAAEDIKDAVSSSSLDKALDLELKVDLVKELKDRLGKDLASRGDASKDIIRSSDLFSAMRSTLNDAGVADTSRQIRDHRAHKITSDPEAYERAMDAKKRSHDRRQQMLEDAESTRKRILDRKVADGTATARDHRRPLTESGGRPSTELGRMLEEKRASILENSQMAKMFEQFATTAANQGLIANGQSAADVLGAIAPVATMEGGENQVVEIQKALLKEMQRQGKDGDKLVRAFQTTGDRIVNNMGYGE